MLLEKDNTWGISRIPNNPVPFWDIFGMKNVILSLVALVALFTPAVEAQIYVTRVTFPGDVSQEWRSTTPADTTDEMFVSVLTVEGQIVRIAKTPDVEIEFLVEISAAGSTAVSSYRYVTLYLRDVDGGTRTVTHHALDGPPAETDVGIQVTLPNGETLTYTYFEVLAYETGIEV